MLHKSQLIFKKRIFWKQLEQSLICHNNVILHCLINFSLKYFFIMHLLDFLVQNSNVRPLSKFDANEQKGGRRFVTTSYFEFLDKWTELNIAGEGHNMCVTMPTVGVGGTYCIEW